MNDLIKQACIVLITIVISMTGFWMMIGRDLVTREEVSSMIAKEAPYMKDRSLILDSLVQNRKSNEALEKAINTNTQAIIEFKIYLQELRRTREQPLP